jgi:hypothetical protein
MHSFWGRERLVGFRELTLVWITLLLVIRLEQSRWRGGRCRVEEFSGCGNPTWLVVC